MPFDGSLFVDVLPYILDPLALLQDACHVTRDFAVNGARAQLHDVSGLNDSSRSAEPLEVE
jgi:hypothetical protein